MSYLLSLLTHVGLGRGREDVHLDDDWVDRLHHEVSTRMFVLFCLIISTRHYVSDPVHCWSPGHFTNNYRQYANKICWVSNTYYLPVHEAIPDQTPTELISYYQWVPMFLLVQALLFYLPYLFWKVMNHKSGIDLSGVIEASKTMNSNGNKDKSKRFVVHQLERYSAYYRANDCCLTSKLPEKCRFRCGKKYGNFMVCLYLTTKTIYLLNAIAQLFLLDSFLSTDFHMYGVRVIQGMITKETWPAARVFPRTAMCDFTVRALGNTHRHTVQCVLSINFFNEKIYVIIWFWLVLLCFLTGVSLIIWFVRIVFHSNQLSYVKRHLRCMDKLRASSGSSRTGAHRAAYDKKLLTRFVSDYLRQDGVLVLRLVQANVNSLVVSEVIAQLWEHFLANPRMIRSKHYADSDADEV